MGPVRITANIETKLSTLWSRLLGISYIACTISDCLQTVVHHPSGVGPLIWLRRVCGELELEWATNRSHLMKRLSFRAPRRGKQYGSRSWRVFSAIEVLEARQLLCVDDLDADGAESVADLDHDAEGSHLDGQEMGTFPMIDAHRRVLVASSSTSGTTTTVAASSPLTSIPVLNSLPGAAVSLYLDFDGHFESSWGSYSNITQPAFDQDGDASTFSDGELATIQNIWQYIAEDYSPFKVNVTTVQPASFANGAALRISIGGDGSWIGPYGGVAYVDSFTNSISNVVFVFPKNLANGNAKYTAEASSHESGHGFGLQHQSLYSGTTKLDEYYAGPGDGRAPIMGDSYSATRGLWWYGTSAVSSTTIQDDMAVISRTANGFGYRLDDYGNTAATASALTVSGSQLSGSGFITTTNDVDFFAFTTDAGQIGINVSVMATFNDLDAKLQLFDANGGLIATSDSSTSFGASITATVAAGSYRVAVSSHGGYGDVGQYAVSGTIVVSANSVGAPSNLVAATQSTSQINLSWIDNATNETGFRVDQSFDGVTWTTIATLGANSTSLSALDLTAGTNYAFRVSAFNATSVSDFSNVVTTATLTLAPTNLAATAVSSSRIDLTWSDVSGETGYKIERSTDGTTWTQIATTSANATSYSNTGLNSATAYSYRVKANNAGGDSAPSNVTSVTTLTAPALPTAPTSLSAVAAGSNRVNLTWADNSSNENGFQIWRTSNNGRSWTNIANVSTNTASFTDNGVSARKTYSYAVRAFNGTGYSAYSNTATVTTPRASAGGAHSLGHSAAVTTRSQTDALPTSSASSATTTSVGGALLSTGSRSADSVRDAATDRSDTTVFASPSSSAQEEPATPTNASQWDDFESLAAVFSHPTLLGECLA